MSVNLDHARLLLGLKGQHLGLVRRATLDTRSGELRDLILETRWQQLRIPWRRVSFDEQEDVFRLLTRALPQAPH